MNDQQRAAMQMGLVKPLFIAFVWLLPIVVLWWPIIERVAK